MGMVEWEGVSKVRTTLSKAIRILPTSFFCDLGLADHCPRLRCGPSRNVCLWYPAYFVSFRSINNFFSLHFSERKKKVRMLIGVKKKSWRKLEDSNVRIHSWEMLMSKLLCIRVLYFAYSTSFLCITILALTPPKVES